MKMIKKIWKAFVEDRSLMMILLVICYFNIPIVRLFINLYILLKVLEFLALALTGICRFVYDVAITLTSNKKR
jgi:hypothetical protein